MATRTPLNNPTPPSPGRFSAVLRYRLAPGSFVAGDSRRRWRELNTTSKAAIVAGAAVQLTLLGAALADLRRRRPDELNGPRKLWVAVSFVNFVGPLAYFLFGRRRQPTG